jgi:hypothetical protein
MALKGMAQQKPFLVLRSKNPRGYNPPGALNWPDGDESSGQLPW